MLDSLYPLVLLACPIGMGLMMWMMMRGGNKEKSAPLNHQDEEIARLRTEVERLRIQQENELFSQQKDVKVLPQ